MPSNDFRFALRTLSKSPGFAIAAALTIGLGIGASTMIFSVLNTVLLRPLPYAGADRLVLVCNDLRQRNVKDFPISNADFLDLRSGAHDNFEDFAAVFTNRGPVQRSDGTPEQVRFAAVSTNFFRMMGASISFGRDFQDSDGVPQPPAAAPTPGAPPAPRLPLFAILSYEYFQRRFSGDTSILGKQLPVIGAASPIVVGVASPGLELLFPPASNIEQFPDAFFAARIPYDPANRNNVQWRVIGRMKPAAAARQAQAEIETVASRLARVNPVARLAGQYFRVEPMKQHLVSEVRPAVLALMGAVIFLLLIACANVANLMLVRASLRHRELAVRLALGGTRWRMIRQMLAEALVLASAGTLLGVGLAWAGIRELVAIAPANLPRLNRLAISPEVLVFSILIGLAAAVLFGILPALRAARADLNEVLRSSGRTPDLAGGGLLRKIVVIAEVALCFVLLVGSGLMFRTFLAIQRVDTGFDPRRLLTFQLQGNFGDTPDARAAFMRQIHGRLSSIPGVQAVAASFPMPLAGGFNPVRWGTAGAQTDLTRFQAADLQIVLPGYFEAMGTRLLAGRTFNQADNTPDRNLIIVDQALAAKAFPSESAVGKRILFRVRTPEAQWGEIVGVVAHQRDVSLSDPGREQLYVTDGYLNHGVAGWWAVRTEGDPAHYADAIRREIGSAGAQLLINDMQPMETRVVHAGANTRFSLLLIAGFGALSLALAGVGLYGVLSTVVRQRTAEIGVRMALGAMPSQIFRLVVGEGLRLSATGVIFGLAAAFELTRVMKSMLVGVEPTDPGTFIAMAGLFFLIAAVASWLPARRAAALDPACSLHDE